ncbi:hypothetical protein [Actinomadura sp. 9N215]|uniref:hypothetical protein n=1 Tax=Actinomadura sp. 9N215 TaxID=3375150 RepID=UPI0037BD8F5A
MTTHTLPEPLAPERIRDLEIRADAVHPDEPIASAGEVLALIRTARDSDAAAVALGMQATRVRELAREWIANRDIQLAAAGRIVLAALDGRQAAYTGLI